MSFPMVHVMFSFLLLYSYTGIVNVFSFDREEQHFNLNNGKFSFTINYVPLV